jgi:hypothetical protein
MDREQFDREMSDDRITKFVVSTMTEPVGLLTMTLDVGGIVWVSPDYYRNRYPAKSLRGRLFYVTNMLTDPDYRGHDPFMMLVEAACRHAAGGVLGFDICQSNVDRGLARALRRRISQLHEGACAFEELDTQTFFGVDLTGPIVGT